MPSTGHRRIAASEPAASHRLPMLADRVRSLYAHTGSSLLGNGLGALIVASLMLRLGAAAGDAAPWRSVVVAWIAATAAMWCLRLGLALAHHRAGPQTDAELLAWRWRWNAAALASGALWGWAGWAFYPVGQVLEQTALLLIVNGLCVGSIPSLATQGRVYLLYVGLALMPLVARLVLRGDAPGLVLAGVEVMVFASAAMLGRNFRRAFDQLLQLQAQTALLNTQLRQETQVADQARRQAEAATQAKTQFFAAASHDLRQPLQALGLFTQALAERNRDVSLDATIGKTAAAVNALDTLFTQLLDVTQIDAGGVAPRPRELALGELFHRLRLHFEPLAFDKGLLLRLRGAHLVVHTDPLLLERILRNLLSNAIRYTQDGGVLVAARLRGDTVLLQVWDSGVGIPVEDQARIFEEFVRIGADPDAALTAAPVPAGHRGLGLGLAIARRLAGLLNVPLEVRSVPGRGSVFSLRVVRGGRRAPGASST